MHSNLLISENKPFKDKERANEEGCGENDQGGEESNGVTGKISRVLPANTVLVDPAAHQLSSVHLCQNALGSHTSSE